MPGFEMLAFASIWGMMGNHVQIIQCRKSYYGCASFSLKIGRTLNHTTFHIHDVSVPFHDDEDPDDPLVAMEQAELDHDNTLSECDSENIPELTLDDVARESGPEPTATQTDHSGTTSKGKIPSQTSRT